MDAPHFLKEFKVMLCCLYCFEESILDTSILEPLHWTIHLTVIHNFGCHDDAMMIEKSGSSLEHFPEKSYLLSTSINYIFEGCLQATYIFSCDNA
jgi:hypothetical protein